MKWVAVLLFVALAIDGLPALNVGHSQIASSAPGDKKISGTDLREEHKAKHNQQNSHAKTQSHDGSSLSQTEPSRRHSKDIERTRDQKELLESQQTSSWTGDETRRTEESKKDRFSRHGFLHNGENQDESGQYDLKKLLSSLGSPTAIQRGPHRHTSFHHVPSQDTSEALFYNQNQHYGSDNRNYGSRYGNYGETRGHIGNLGNHNGRHVNGIWNHPQDNDQLLRGTLHNYPGTTNSRNINGDFVQGGGSNAGQFAIEDDSEDEKSKYISDILTQAQYLLKHGSEHNAYGITPEHHHTTPIKRGPIYGTPNHRIRFYDTETAGAIMANPSFPTDVENGFGEVVPGYVVPTVIAPGLNAYPNGRVYRPNSYYRNGGFSPELSYIPSTDGSSPTTIFGRSPLINLAPVLPISEIPVRNAANEDGLLIDRTLKFAPLTPLIPLTPLEPLPSFKTPVKTFDNYNEGTSGDASVASDIVIDRDFLTQYDTKIYGSEDTIQNFGYSTTINKDLNLKHGSESGKIDKTSTITGNNEKTVVTGKKDDKTIDRSIVIENTHNQGTDEGKKKQPVDHIKKVSGQDNGSDSKDIDETTKNNKPVMTDKARTTEIKNANDQANDKTAVKIKKVLGSDNSPYVTDNENDGSYENEKTTENEKIDKNGKDKDNKTVKKVGKNSGTSNEQDGKVIAPENPSVVKGTNKNGNDKDPNDKTVENIDKGSSGDASDIVVDRDFLTQYDTKVYGSEDTIQNFGYSTTINKDLNLKHGSESGKIDKTSTITGNNEKTVVTGKKDDKTIDRSIVIENTHNQGTYEGKKEQPVDHIKKFSGQDNGSDSKDIDETYKNNKPVVTDKARTTEIKNTNDQANDKTAVKIKKVLGSDNSPYVTDNEDDGSSENEKTTENEKNYKNGKDKDNKTVKKVGKNSGTSNEQDGKVIAPENPSVVKGTNKNGNDKDPNDKTVENIDKSSSGDASVASDIVIDRDFLTQYHNKVYGSEDTIQNFGYSTTINKDLNLKHGSESGKIDKTSTITGNNEKTVVTGKKDDKTIDRSIVIENTHNQGTDEGKKEQPVDHIKKVLGQDNGSDSKDIDETTKNNKPVVADKAGTTEIKNTNDQTNDKTAVKITKVLGFDNSPDVTDNEEDSSYGNEKTTENGKIVKNGKDKDDKTVKNIGKISETSNEQHSKVTAPENPSVVKGTNKNGNDKDTNDKTVENIDKGSRTSSEEDNRDTDKTTKNIKAVGTEKPTVIKITDKNENGKNNKIVEEDIEKGPGTSTEIDTKDTDKTIKNTKAVVTEKPKVIKNTDQNEKGKGENENDKIVEEDIEKGSGTSTEQDTKDTDKTTKNIKTVVIEKPTVIKINEKNEKGKGQNDKTAQNIEKGSRTITGQVSKDTDKTTNNTKGILTEKLVMINDTNKNGKSKDKNDNNEEKIKKKSGTNRGEDSKDTDKTNKNSKVIVTEKSLVVNDTDKDGKDKGKNDEDVSKIKNDLKNNDEADEKDTYESTIDSSQTVIEKPTAIKSNYQNTKDKAVEKYNNGLEKDDNKDNDATIKDSEPMAIEKSTVTKNTEGKRQKDKTVGSVRQANHDKTTKSLIEKTTVIKNTYRDGSGNERIETTSTETKNFPSENQSGPFDSDVDDTTNNSTHKTTVVKNSDKKEKTVKDTEKVLETTEKSEAIDNNDDKTTKSGKPFVKNSDIDNETKNYITEKINENSGTNKKIRPTESNDDETTKNDETILTEKTTVVKNSAEDKKDTSFEKNKKPLRKDDGSEVIGRDDDSAARPVKSIVIETTTVIKQGSEKDNGANSSNNEDSTKNIKSVVTDKTENKDIDKKDDIDEKNKKATETDYKLDVTDKDSEENTKSFNEPIVDQTTQIKKNGGLDLTVKDDKTTKYGKSFVIDKDLDKDGSDSNGNRDNENINSDEPTITKKTTVIYKGDGSGDAKTTKNDIDDNKTIKNDKSGAVNKTTDVENTYEERNENNNKVKTDKKIGKYGSDVNSDHDGTIKTTVVKKTTYKDASGKELPLFDLKTNTENGNTSMLEDRDEDDVDKATTKKPFLKNTGIEESSTEVNSDAIDKTSQSNNYKEDENDETVKKTNKIVGFGDGDQSSDDNNDEEDAFGKSVEDRKLGSSENKENKTVLTSDKTGHDESNDGKKNKSTSPGDTSNVESVDDDDDEDDESEKPEKDMRSENTDRSGNEDKSDKDKSSRNGDKKHQITTKIGTVVGQKGQQNNESNSVVTDKTVQDENYNDQNYASKDGDDCRNENSDDGAGNLPRKPSKCGRKKDKSENSDGIEKEDRVDNDDDESETARNGDKQQSITKIGTVLKQTNDIGSKSKNIETDIKPIANNTNKDDDNSIENSDDNEQYNLPENDQKIVVIEDDDNTGNDGQNDEDDTRESGKGKEIDELDNDDDLPGKSGKPVESGNSGGKKNKENKGFDNADSSESGGRNEKDADMSWSGKDGKSEINGGIRKKVDVRFDNGTSDKKDQDDKVDKDGRSGKDGKSGSNGGKTNKEDISSDNANRSDNESQNYEDGETSSQRGQTGRNDGKTRKIVTKIGTVVEQKIDNGSNSADSENKAASEDETSFINKKRIADKTDENEEKYEEIWYDGDDDKSTGTSESNGDNKDIKTVESKNRDGSGSEDRDNHDEGSVQFGIDSKLERNSDIKHKTNIDTVIKQKNNNGLDDSETNENDATSVGTSSEANQTGQDENNEVPVDETENDDGYCTDDENDVDDDDGTDDADDENDADDDDGTNDENDDSQGDISERFVDVANSGIGKQNKTAVGLENGDSSDKAVPYQKDDGQGGKSERKNITKTATVVEQKNRPESANSEIDATSKEGIYDDSVKEDESSNVNSDDNDDDDNYENGLPKKYGKAVKSGRNSGINNKKIGESEKSGGCCNKNRADRTDTSSHGDKLVRNGGKQGKIVTKIGTDIGKNKDKRTGSANSFDKNNQAGNNDGKKGDSINDAESKNCEDDIKDAKQEEVMTENDEISRNENCDENKTDKPVKSAKPGRIGGHKHKTEQKEQNNDNSKEDSESNETSIDSKSTETPSSNQLDVTDKTWRTKNYRARSKIDKKYVKKTKKDLKSRTVSGSDFKGDDSKNGESSETLQKILTRNQKPRGTKNIGDSTESTKKTVTGNISNNGKDNDDNGSCKNSNGDSKNDLTTKNNTDKSIDAKKQNDRTSGTENDDFDNKKVAVTHYRNARTKKTTTKINTPKFSNSKKRTKMSTESRSRKSTGIDDEQGRPQNKNGAENCNEEISVSKNKETSSQSNHETKESSSSPTENKSDEKLDSQSNDSKESRGSKERSEESSKSSSGSGSDYEEKTLSKEAEKTLHKKSFEDNDQSDKQEDYKFTEENNDSKEKTLQSGQSNASEVANKNSSDNLTEESYSKDSKKANKESSSSEDKKNQVYSSKESKTEDSNGKGAQI